MANDIIDRARLHFRADERRRVEVPEWGDASGPLVLFYAPITLADKAKLRARMNEESLQAMWAQTLILKAQREDGKPAFTLDDKRALMHSVSPEVVERVAGQMLLSASLEDAEKN